MSIKDREVKNKRDKNGLLTGKSGTVYDVHISYTNYENKRTSYQKKGFLNRADASAHEKEMKAKLLSPNTVDQQKQSSKIKLADYMNEWLDIYAINNLKHNTYQGYKTNVEKHINPAIGHFKLSDISGKILDSFYQSLFDDKKLSNGSVRYVHRTLSIALEHAKKRDIIPKNPARDTFTKFTQKAETPPPYTIEQVKKLMEGARGTKWEMIVVLAGLYGLRRNEILGLTRDNIFMDRDSFAITQQLAAQKVIKQGGDLFGDTKEFASVRVLPITEDARPYFDRYLDQLESKLEKVESDHGLLFFRDNGAPMEATHMSREFRKFIEHLDLPPIRFHDLRHTAATNMHELTGDVFTVGKILGHSVKGIGTMLDVSGLERTATSNYIDVRKERMKTVLDTYHNAVHKPSLKLHKSKDQRPRKASGHER